MGKARVKEALRTALRIFGYQVAFGFIGFMLIPSLMSASAGIRIPIVGLFIAAVGVLIFMDGSYQGEKDCAMGDTLEKLARKGTYNPSDDENAKRYKRGKGIVAAFISALPVLLPACYVALTATPYVYTLQDLPSWMSGYIQRPEIGRALEYLGNIEVSATLTDYLRIFVRFLLFPYIGLPGELGDAGSLLFDRLSPLLALILPAVSAIGYQFGPRRRAKSVKAIEQAKHTPRKRLKKTAKRGGGDKEKKQLI